MSILKEYLELSRQYQELMKPDSKEKSALARDILEKSLTLSLQALKQI